MNRITFSSTKKLFIHFLGFPFAHTNQINIWWRHMVMLPRQHIKVNTLNINDNKTIENAADWWAFHLYLIPFQKFLFPSTQRDDLICGKMKQIPCHGLNNKIQETTKTLVNAARYHCHVNVIILFIFTFALFSLYPFTLENVNISRCMYVSSQRRILY